MSEVPQKRKALEQLSPYSDILADEPINIEPVTNDTAQSTTKRPRARRNKGTEIKGNLKGIFSGVCLSSPQESLQNKKIDSLIAGVNRSFIRAIERVLAKQSNKDLTYLLLQYENFMKEIKKGEK